MRLAKFLLMAPIWIIAGLALGILLAAIAADPDSPKYRQGSPD